jgi:hypothetical protein
VPHTYQQMLAAGAAHHLTHRQIRHWTNLGLLRTADGRCGPGRHQQWADGEHHIAALMARLVTAGIRDLNTAHRIARGNPHLCPGITIHIHDQRRTPVDDGHDMYTMPELPRLTPGPLTDPALGPVAA